MGWWISPDEKIISEQQRSMAVLEQRIAELEAANKQLLDELGWHKLKLDEDEWPPENVWLLYRRQDSFGVSFTLSKFFDEDGKRSIPTFATHWKYVDTALLPGRGDGH